MSVTRNHFTSLLEHELKKKKRKEDMKKFREKLERETRERNGKEWLIYLQEKITNETNTLSILGEVAAVGAPDSVEGVDAEVEGAQTILTREEVYGIRDSLAEQQEVMDAMARDFSRFTMREASGISQLLDATGATYLRSQYGVSWFWDMAYRLPDLAGKKSTTLVEYR
ncbi:hypothetical protein Tco_0403549 [Tanacetum coccineum]